MPTNNSDGDQKGFDEINNKMSLQQFVDTMTDPEKRRNEVEAYNNHLMTIGYEEPNGLLYAEKFHVQMVVSETDGGTFAPSREIKYGGYSPEYPKGDSSKLTIKVIPEREGVPIKTLEFLGPSIVRGGDYIEALIPKYTEEKFEEDWGRISMLGGRKAYVERDWGENESALEIKIIGINLKEGEESVERIDRATNYMPKEDKKRFEGIEWKD